MRLKLQGEPKVLHWIDADKLETLDSNSVKLHFTCSATPVCKKNQRAQIKSKVCTA